MQEKPNKWRPAIIAGLAIGTVSGLPVISFVNCCCCAGILGGGVFAYYLYRQEYHEGMPPLESSDGLILGIMAGVIGAFVQTLLHGLIMVLFAGAQEELMRNILDKVIDRLESSGSFPSDAVEQMREQIEQSLKQQRTMWGILSNLFTSLVIYPIFAMLGGLLGYGIFKPKKPSATSTPQQ
jgi:hypothetical protein